MHYLTSMGNILTFNARGLSTDTGLKQLQAYCILNVMVLGLIYGCSAAFFSRALLTGSDDINAGFSVMKVIVAGIPAAFLMHAGAALFVWVFLKAIGGKADFLTAYFHMGTAAISLWSLAPFVAVLQIGEALPLIKLLAGVFGVYGFCVTIAVAKAVFGLTTVRMTFATLVTVTYISCFLYLWV